MSNFMRSATLVLATAVAVLPGRAAQARDPGAFAQIHHVAFDLNTPGAIVPCTAIHGGLYNAATRGNLNVVVNQQFTYLSGGQTVTVSAIRHLVDMRFVEEEGNNTVLVDTLITGAPPIDSGSTVTVDVTMSLLEDDGQTVQHTFPTETATVTPEFIQGPSPG